MNKSKTKQAIRRSLTAKFVGEDAVAVTVTDLLTGTVNAIVFNFIKHTVEEKEVNSDGE